MFDRKRIPANSNPNIQKRFRENEMTSFFGQVSRYSKTDKGINPETVNRLAIDNIYSSLSRSLIWIEHFTGEEQLS